MNGALAPIVSPAPPALAAADEPGAGCDRSGDF